MKSPVHPLFALLVPALSVAAGGCAVDTAPAPAGEPSSAVSVPLIRSNCSFIPGCVDLLEASDGPFHVSVTTYQTDAGVERFLHVRYVEAPYGKFLMCHLFPGQPALSLVFVLGGAAVTRPMRTDCPTSWGDNGGVSNSATLWLKESDDPGLWDTLFPRAADGSRWYAVQLAAANASGAWDSRYGRNYRLVLAPR